MRTQVRRVRVRTEVAALAKTFDYAVPARWADDIRVGTRVRVPLHGRSVRGWVVETDVGTPAGVGLLPLKSWLGWGPPPGVVELAEWASWRSAGPASFFLHAASPSVVVHALPQPPPPMPPPQLRDTAPASRPDGEGRVREWGGALARPGATVVRLPPATDLIDLVLSVVKARTSAPGGAASSSWSRRPGGRYD